MSQLAWFPFYVNDYLGDTSRLSYGQHGVYLLLLAEYWRGGPIEDDLDLMCRICAGAPPELVRSILEKYWVRTDVGWKQARMEKIKSDQQVKHERRVNAGRLGGESKAKKLSNASSNASSISLAMNVATQNSDIRLKELRDADLRATEGEVRVNTDTRKRADTHPKAPDLDFSTWPGMPTEQTMKDWKAMRKSKKYPLSQTVITRLGSKLHAAAKLGYSVDDCLAECVLRGWRGLEPEWLANAKVGVNGTKVQLSKAERLEEYQRRSTEEFLRMGD